MQEQKTCAIIGATPDEFSFGYDEEYPDAIFLKAKIAELLLTAISEGCTEFISSLYQGVEFFAAEACTAIISGGSRIRLICVPDGEDQANRWHPDVRERYFRLLENCTEVVKSDSPKEYILNNCDLIIAIGDTLPSRVSEIIEEAARIDIKVITIK